MLSKAASDGVMNKPERDFLKFQWLSRLLSLMIAFAFIIQLLLILGTSIVLRVFVEMCSFCYNLPFNPPPPFTPTQFWL